MAVRLLAWQYERKQLPLPEPDALRVQAEQIVDEAHRIARQRGRNVIVIMKELIDDIKKGKNW